MYFFWYTHVYISIFLACPGLLPLQGLSLPCFTYFVTVLDFILFVVLIISIFLPIRRFLIVQVELYSIEDDAEFNKGVC